MMRFFRMREIEQIQESGVLTQGAYSQSSNVSHYISAKLTVSPRVGPRVSPSEHLILDSHYKIWACKIYLAISEREFNEIKIILRI